MIDQRALWDQRASLGAYSGSRDRTAKRLEIEAIAGQVQTGDRFILDAGCGDGETALALRWQFPIYVDAFDLSEMMIALAEHQRTARTPVLNNTSFMVSNIFDYRIHASVPAWGHGYDMVYTERMIINLPDWATQLRAIHHLMDLLRPGGRYVMVECCQEGLNQINELRGALGLSEIVPPGHNRYLRNAEIWQAVQDGLLPVPREVDYSSTYYFLSRIVNAVLADQSGQAPDYDAAVNQLALRLPALLPGLGQGRMWIFEREDEEDAGNGYDLEIPRS